MGASPIVLLLVRRSRSDLPNFISMRERKEQNGNSQPALPSLQESLQTIHDFIDAFPAIHLEERSWELVFAAFNSEIADTWSSRERGDMLQLYKQLSQLGYALTVVDRELWPLYSAVTKFDLDRRVR